MEHDDPMEIEALKQEIREIKATLRQLTGQKKKANQAPPYTP